MFGLGSYAVLSMALVIAATVTTFLRLYHQKVHMNALDASDWTNLVALFFLVALTVVENFWFPVFYRALSVDMDEPASESTLQDHFKCLQFLVAEAALTNFAMTSAKLSIVLWYKKKFWIDRKFVRWCYAVMGLIGIVSAANFFALFWVCGSPYDFLHKSRCHLMGDNPARFRIIMMSCGLSLVTHICIIVLPLPVLKTLRITRRQKIGLVALFTLATSDLLLEIPRSVFATNLEKVGWFEKAIIITVVEANVAVMVCAAPVIRGLINHSTNRTPYRPRRRSSIYLSPPFLRAGTGSGIQVTREVTVEYEMV